MTSKKAMPTNTNLIAICGTTASGKTRLAIAIARRTDGEILSVDSRQVYRHMDIGTGKDLDEYTRDGERVPLHLVDIVEPAETYTLWHYQRDFYAAWRDARNRGKMPIACGGTGLYLEAVLRGYALSATPPDEAARRDLEQLSLDELLRMLASAAPAAYGRTDKANKRRVVRALEVALADRRAPAQPLIEPPEIHPLVIGVRWPREELRPRIRQRLDDRLAAGMIEEVRRLKESGIAEERLDAFGLEYRFVLRHLRGELPFDEMREQLAVAIGQFAKRQETWFRGMERRGVKVRWVDRGDVAAALEIVKREILDQI
jgi:tRNA dimethylallyltransferase